MITIRDAGQRLILGLSPKQRVEVKESLTVENPSYVQAKRHSKWGTAGNVSQYLHFYKEYEDSLIVPRGYKPPFQYEEINERTDTRVLYPKFKYELRDAQKNAYEAFKGSSGSGLFVLPTGAGKTILGLYLAGKLRQRTLIVVQKNDLVDGWMKDAYNTYGIKKENIGLIKAQKRKIGRTLTLSTIQTLSKLQPQEILKLSEQFGMIILDECHHVVANSYKILTNIKSKHAIGFTATDIRGDGLGDIIPLMFGEIIYRATEDDVKDSILPVNVILKYSNVVYKGEVRYSFRGQIYKEHEAMALQAQGYHVNRMGIDSHERDSFIDTNLDFNTQVVNDILYEAQKGRSCVVFCKKRYQLDILQKLLEKQFKPEKIAQYVGGSKDDALFVERAESKEILITLTTLKKATEGTNVKAWECGFLVSSLKSKGDVIQAVGRVRRKIDGEKHPIIYDYRHPRVYGLATHEKGRDSAYKAIKAKVIDGRINRKGNKLSRGFF